MRTRCAVLCLMLLFAVAPARAALTRPANDSFAKAKAIPSVPWNETRSTANATLESHETQATCGKTSSTVWYKITPQVSEPIGVSSMGSKYDTSLAVYTGSKVSKLTQLSCSNDAGTRPQSMVGWIASAGTTYYIQAGTVWGSPGSLVIRLAYGTKLDGSPGSMAPTLGGFYIPFAIAIAADQNKQETAVRLLFQYCATQAFCFAFDMVQADTSRKSGGGGARACVVIENCYEAVTP